MRIVAAGSNQLLAEEMLEATKLILGSDVNIQAVLTSKIAGSSSGDLFICGPTQINALMQAVPVEKIIVLNLKPISQFFVQIARIPAGEDVYIFNNKLEYTKVLADYCSNLGVSGINFIPLAYEEMPEQEVCGKLRQANFIIGVDKLVGPSVLLSSRYRDCVKPGAVIVGAKRVASIQSACALIQWVAVHFQKDISERVAKITDDLQSTVEEAGVGEYEKDFAVISGELAQLVNESARSTEAIRKAVIQSVVSQIAPGLAMPDERQMAQPSEANGEAGHTVTQIFKTLKDISSLSDELLGVTKKLGQIK